MSHSVRAFAASAGASLAVALTAATPPIAITEWMYDGGGPTGGEFVEFTNVGTEPVDLTGWSFDDSQRMAGAFDLSAIATLAPGESAIVTQDPPEAFRAAWGLPASLRIVGNLGTKTGNNLGRNDEINLFDATGELVDRLTYGDQAFAGSIRTRWISGVPQGPAAIGANQPLLWRLSATGDDQGARTNAFGDVGSPGSYTPPAPPPFTVSLNEVMVSNASTIADEDGDFPDWIEIHNFGASGVDVGGYGISDSETQPFRWVLPSRTIEPGGFLLVFASGKNRLVGELHTNFSIAAGSEPVLLTHPTGHRVDELASVHAPTDTSFGRQPDGLGPWWTFVEPTPGAANLTAGTNRARPADFSHPAGFHENPFLLTLSAEPGATIHYTLDGSIPTAASPVYEEPLEISSRAGSPNVHSIIQTAPNEGWTPPATEVFKATTVRCMAIRPGAESSEIATATYFVDPTIRERYPLPVISIVTDPRNLFDYVLGIYVPGQVYDANYDPEITWWHRVANYTMRGEEWERSAHLEFFETGGVPTLSQTVGLRIHGGVSRSYRCKTLRVYARSEYGRSTLDHEIFPGDPLRSFKRILLRNSGQDFGNTMFHDAMLQSLLDGIDIDRQAYRPAIVFLNGEYWGIHNIRERLDKHYLASRHGVDPDAVDILEAHATVEEGSNGDYLALHQRIHQSDPADAAEYDWIRTKVDVANHMTYFAFQVYIRNHDWPQNNIGYWRPQHDDGRWRWLLYDTDLSFFHGSVDTDSLGRVFSLNHPNASFFRRLLRNPDYRDDFINRYADLMNTIFTPAFVNERIDRMRAGIAVAMQEHLTRWRSPWSLATWDLNINNRRQFAHLRPAHARQHVVDNFALPGQAALTVLPVDPTEGRVTVNTVDLPGGDGPWSGIYFQSVPVPIRGHPATGYRFAGFAELDASPERGLVWWVPDSDTQILTPRFVLRADLDGNGRIDASDLAIVLANWGLAGDADLNDDETVNGADLALFLSMWN